MAGGGVGMSFLYCCIFKHRGRLCRIFCLLFSCTVSVFFFITLKVARPCCFSWTMDDPGKSVCITTESKAQASFHPLPLSLRHFIQIQICTLSPVSLSQLQLHVVPPPLPHFHWIRSHCALISQTPSIALMSGAFSVLFHPVQLNKLPLMIVIK